MDDPYSVLGVMRDAPEEVVKAAYRALAKKYHPDKWDDKRFAEEKLKPINTAYEQIIFQSQQSTQVMVPAEAKVKQDVKPEEKQHTGEMTSTAGANFLKGLSVLVFWGSVFFVVMMLAVFLIGILSTVIEDLLK